MERDELKAVILEALAEHDRERRKVPPPSLEMSALYEVWKQAFGPVTFGRFVKAFKPVLKMYDPQWIANGIDHYAADAARSGKPQFYTPEKFASLAVHFILPSIPSNELTEKEAKFLGPEMVASRAHAETLGLLTDRARG